DRRDAGGGRRGPARGLRLRVDRHDLPGAEDRQHRDLHLRPVDPLRLPFHVRALRELGPAPDATPVAPPAGPRRDARAIAPRNALGVVIAFGIAGSTLLGQFVIPVYFVLGERIRGTRTSPGHQTPVSPEVDGHAPETHAERPDPVLA